MCSDKSSREKILIVKPSSLGDILHTLPAVALLADAWPQAEFHWLVNSPFKDIIAYCPAVTEIIESPRRRLGSWRTFLPALAALRQQLRRHNYRRVIDFQGLLRSAAVARLAPAEEYIGFAAPREKLARLFYNRLIAVPGTCRHAVDKNLSLAEQICHVHSKDYHLPSLPQFAASARQLMAQVPKQKTLVAVALGARWESKRWSAAFFADLLEQLLHNVSDISIILLGASDSLPEAEFISHSLNSSQITSLVGQTTLPELIEVIQLSNLLICNDSGPMHIAAAAGKTVFAFFGPTVPEQTGPYGKKHYIFQRDLHCIGCLKRYCPSGEMACHDLDIDEIVRKIKKYTNQI